jgi:hypothetical protein
MHERLTTEDPKVAVAMLFGIIDDSVEILFADHLTRRSHIDPATLTSQLARIDDGDEQKRRKVNPLLETLFVLLYRPHPLESEVIGELPKQPFVHGSEHASCEFCDHGFEGAC